MVGAAGNQKRRIHKFDPTNYLTTDYMDNNHLYDFVASYTEVIAVSATDMRGRVDCFASFSNYGPAIELAAPGDSIVSTSIGGGTGNVGRGTSYAAPHVAGTAALVLAKYPDLTADQVRVHLQGTAESLRKLTDEQQGYGLVDAEMAVTIEPDISLAPSRWRSLSPSGKLSITWGEIKGK